MEIRNHKLGVIIPYRNRHFHIKKLLYHLQKELVKQQISFEVIIVEQGDDKPFNRGKLLNIGFRKAIELNCTYVAFHDVDMLPVDVDYSYVNRPTHMATDLKGTTERVVTDTYFGGVTLFPIEDFQKINGYSNEYWGWGFEDDDLLQRYRMNFDDHQTKVIQMKSNNTVGIKFDGENSYIESPNPFDLKTFTILISCEPEEIETDSETDFNEYAIFSVPGYDMVFSYDSFGRYKFQTWDYKKNLISLNSDISFAKRTVLMVTVNQHDKVIKFYQDGKMVDEVEYDKKLKRYSKPEHIYIGNIGDVYTKRLKFKGIVDYFTIWNHDLEKEQVLSIYNNLHMGLTARFDGYSATHCLEMCYDMKIGSENEVFDLSDHGRNGKMYSCERIVIEQSVSNKEIIVPWRKRGKFLLLEHEENGFVDNQWKQPETIKNQNRFNKEMLVGTIDISKDGLSTLKFKLKEESIDNNVHILKVKL